MGQSHQEQIRVGYNGWDTTFSEDFSYECMEGNNNFGPDFQIFPKNEWH